ncbi:MAG: UTP--glucose-1-phosphate uridylyltransferase GalU [Methanomassiliicoccales archaeon]|nr:UTP--glucose-1-phosphate uridylyltransferase GalU [Methanomassiliicoccales archaeon]
MLVVMKAVIPAAGWGVRFLPLTKEQPKEMLPVIDKPVIQYVVEEAVKAGIQDIIIITGRHKRTIEDHFDRSFELEALLQNGNRQEYLQKIKDICNLANLHFIRQKEQKGLGDAVYHARYHVGDEPFAVMLGDTIHVSDVPVVKQLMDVHAATGKSVIAAERVPGPKVKDYGVLDARKIGDRLYDIDDLVEKPKPEDAPSDLCIAGTYVLTPGIFECIERTAPGYNGEVQLTDALRLLKEKEGMLAWEFEGRRYDIGDIPGWLNAQFELGLRHPIYGPKMREHIRTLYQNEKPI